MPEAASVSVPRGRREAPRLDGAELSAILFDVMARGLSQTRLMSTADRDPDPLPQSGHGFDLLTGQVSPHNSAPHGASALTAARKA